MLHWQFSTSQAGFSARGQGFSDKWSYSAQVHWPYPVVGLITKTKLGNVQGYMILELMTSQVHARHAPKLLYNLSIPTLEFGMWSQQSFNSNTFSLKTRIS